jgi:hypothetical protein
MIKKTGYKVNPYLIQVFTDNNSYAGVTMYNSGTLYACGVTYSRIGLNPSTFSGRYFDCLYNQLGQSNSNNPYDFIGTTSIYGISPNVWTQGNIAISGYIDTPTGLDISSSIYRTTSLTPLGNEYLGFSGSWYLTSGNLGLVISKGYYNNFQTSFNLSSGYNGNLIVQVNGTPYTVASTGGPYYFTAKQGDNIIVSLTGSSNAIKSLTISSHDPSSGNITPIYNSSSLQTLNAFYTVSSSLFYYLIYGAVISQYGAQQGGNLPVG